MYLHKDRETFKDIIEQTAEQSGRTPVVVEKDYYVTLILKLLAEQLDLCVFKGGTSLSKGFRVINRFSEDIDITFKEHIGESRRKKLKNVVLKGISEELEMPIANWNETQSDRDYNAYFFSYTSVFELEDERLPQHIKLETALGSYAFPTQSVEIHSFIGDYLEKRNRKDFAKQFYLDNFSMNLQSLERTYIDKIFALCDYYMQGKSKRYSRHLYDIYKLTPLIAFDDKFVGAFYEDLDDILGGVLVKIAGRLVRQDHRGHACQGAGDGHPLLLAAGELQHIALRFLFRQPQALQNGQRRQLGSQ